jgi:hypothetical protein
MVAVNVIISLLLFLKLSIYSYVPNIFQVNADIREMPIILLRWDKESRRKLSHRSRRRGM